MENNNGRDNTVAIIVVGLLAFVGILIVGKYLLDNNRDHDWHHNWRREAMERHEQPRVIVQPPTEQVIIGNPYPQVYPQYHQRNEFWQGYSDGWNGFVQRQNNPAYIQGYAIGIHDRRYNRSYYHDQYCPPGFSLRVPGFNLNIR